MAKTSAAGGSGGGGGGGGGAGGGGLAHVLHASAQPQDHRSRVLEGTGRLLSRGTGARWPTADHCCRASGSALPQLADVLSNVLLTRFARAFRPERWQKKK